MLNILAITATSIRTDDIQRVNRYWGKPAYKMAYGDPHLMAFTPLVISPGVGNFMVHFQQQNRAEGVLDRLGCTEALLWQQSGDAERLTSRLTYESSPLTDKDWEPR